MRLLMMVAVLVALVAGIGTYAYISYLVIGTQAVIIDFEIEPPHDRKIAIGINADTDAVHLGRLSPGSGCAARDVTVTNRYDLKSSVVFKVKGLDEWVVATPKLFVLEPGQMGTTTVSACPPVGAKYGNYSGFLVASFRR